jgi:hypothetical protein
MEVSDQLHAPAALPPGRERPARMGYVAGWAPELARKRRRGEKFPASTGTRTSDHPARSPALTTELSLLKFSIYQTENKLVKCGASVLHFISAYLDSGDEWNYYLYAIFCSNDLCTKFMKYGHHVLEHTVQFHHVAPSWRLHFMKERTIGWQS